MSLSAYHKKRHFKKTPEPKGKHQKTAGPLTFVIQKHEATRLHYDFRLELDGVLKSWAVPKGPSLNPEDRHLAVMVEDHPLAYAGFEGIIPKGNYGAGTVMVWDKGVYSPLETVDRKKAETILQEQIEKGHLTFILLGEKLKGEFALIKTKSTEENAWLLIKKGDEYASKKDILKEDTSILTGRTVKQIKNQAVEKKEIWIGKKKDINLYNASKQSQPEKISPMLSYATDEAFDKKDWIFELKLDGYRTVSFIKNKSVRLVSRNNISYDQKFKEIADSLTTFPTSAVLDGEVVVLDKSGRPQFQWLQDYPKNKRGDLIYYVFDILYYDGFDLTKLSLIKRKEILKQVLPKLPNVRISDYIENEGITFFKSAQKLGIEGIVAKYAQSSYLPGIRSKEWLKIKAQNRQEAIIAGFTKPKGGRKHFGALVLGIYKKGKLTYIGHTGGGFDDNDLLSLYKKLIKLRQDHNPFGQAIETNAPVTWVNPTLICEVSFTEWTEDHMMRHPIFLGLRRDKAQKEVIKEESISDSLSLSISNPTKIFWPKERYTKKDVAEYYKSVSKILLPYLINRPQSLLRFPNGITGESFFQKNLGEITPDWIKTKKITSDHKTVEYMLCQNQESLLYMINLGCIDLNPWNSQIETLDYPDYMVIDLDPEKVSFQTVVTVAKKTQQVLESLSIPSFPKTSGAKGIHIYIPLNAKYTYDQIRQFAELLCIQINNKIPDKTSLLRSPQKRQGKVYLDYLQNRKGQTLASVYSIRPRPSAPVSTPLEWDEVTSRLSPDMFTIKNILKRIEKKGDLFKPVLGKGIAIEKVLLKLNKS